MDVVSVSFSLLTLLLGVIEFRGVAGVVRRIWEQWKRVAKKIGDIQARILLVFFYFILLAPFAAIVRWKSDPLSIKPATRKGWLVRKDEVGTPIERATRQF